VQALNAAVLNPSQTWQRQLLLARIALSAGQPEEADRLSTNLVLLAGLTAQPECTAESWSLRGKIHERLGQTARAIEAYSQNLVATAPLERQREALGKLAELHIARGEVGEAMRKLVGFLDRSTNTAAADVALLSLAELHLKQHVTLGRATNHLEQALELLDRLVKGSPPSPLLGQAHLNRGWCYWLSNQPALSRAAFAEAAARLTPSESLAVAQFKVGDAAYAMKDYAVARDSYRLALATASQFPTTTTNLQTFAWYQLERACLALNDVAGAEAALREILQQRPETPLGERSLLLVAQGYADANRPAPAADLFAEFASRFPDSALRPEVELAAARVAEQKGDWSGAVQRYAAWSARFTNHALLPDVEFYHARATAIASHETNAFGLFTNFVARFPTNSLAPAAKYWLGDYFFRQGDFVEAEKHFSLLYHYWPTSYLAAEACMMAGRAAIGRSGYGEAITHFTNLTSNPNCPKALLSPALFAYGSALRLKEESNSTNRMANLMVAAGVFDQIIQRENTNTDVAAAAWGEIGNTYYQLGALDALYYARALEAYQQVTNIPAASASSRGLAGIGCGLVIEKMPAPTPGEKLPLAFDYYLDVLYDEAGDPFCRKKAGLEAIRLGRELGEWERVEQLCVRLQKLFPPLHASLEKRRVEANEKVRGVKAAGNGESNK
jgi:tetratricopeptide (TPR) repeat protein